LHLRPEPLHVLRLVRRRVSDGRAGADPGFRTGGVHARRSHLVPPNAGARAAAHDLSEIVVGVGQSSVWSWSDVQVSRQAGSSGSAADRFIAEDRGPTTDDAFMNPVATP